MIEQARISSTPLSLLQQSYRIAQGELLTSISNQRRALVEEYMNDLIREFNRLNARIPS